MPLCVKITPLRLRRLQREMKQTDVAKAIGISQQRYSLIELEKVVARKDERKKLNVLFGDES